MADYIVNICIYKGKEVRWVLDEFAAQASN